MATVMAAASIAILQSRFVARWLGWAGVVIAAGGVIGTIGVMAAVRGLADVWFVGLFGWWLWILAVAIGCTVRLRQGRRRTVAPATPQPV